MRPVLLRQVFRPGTAGFGKAPARGSAFLLAMAQGLMAQQEKRFVLIFRAGLLALLPIRPAVEVRLFPVFNNVRPQTYNFRGYGMTLLRGLGGNGVVELG